MTALFAFVIIAMTPFAATTALAAVGDVVTVGVLNYKILTMPGGSNGTVEVGNNVSWSDPSGNLIIPANITVTNGGGNNGTYDVVKISDQAFRNNPNVQSATIPNSVTVIGASAFNTCTMLSDLTIGNSVTTIGDNAFNKCSGLTVLTIPNSVKKIGVSAFQDCENLTGVTIGNSVTTIDNSAFRGMSSLKTMTFLGNAPTFDSYVFFGISNPFSIKVPTGQKTAYEAALAAKSNNLPVGSTITEAGGSTGLISYNGLNYKILTMPGGSNGTVEVTNNVSYNGGPLNIPATITGTGAEAGTYDVIKIADYAFQSCTGITGALTIPNTITTIGKSAFAGCEYVSGLTVRNAVTAIGDEAFASCIGLTTITFQGNAPTFGMYVFAAIQNPLTITVPAGQKAAYKAALALKENILPLGSNIVEAGSSATAVTWTGLTANGTANTVSTTELTFTFNIDPTGLTASNITVEGATKGSLSGTGTTRKLTLSAIHLTVNEGENIRVGIESPSGWMITPSVQTVAVHTGGSTPILSNGTVNRTSDAAATIDFDTDEAGTAYYLVQNSGASAPTSAQVKAGTSLGSVAAGTITDKAVTLTAGAKDMYVVVENAASNISEPLKIEVAAFNSPPTPGGSGAVTASNIGSTSLTLNWTAATDDTTPQGNLRYQVFWITSATTNPYDISEGAEGLNTKSAILTNQTSYNVTGLSPETTYYFAVFVYDEGSEENGYTVVSAKTLTSGSTPILSNGTVNRTGHTAATIGFTTNEAGTAYYLVQNSGAAAPTGAEVKAGTSLGSVAAGTVTGKAVTLTAGAKDIYVVVVDAASNISNPLKIEAAAYVPVIGPETIVYPDGVSLRFVSIEGFGFSNVVAPSDAANANHITVNNTSAVTDPDFVFGGYNTAGASTGNTAILNSGATVNYSVFGGFATNGGDATGNTVTLHSGSSVTNVYGGRTEGVGRASGNTVIIHTGATVNGIVYGGLLNSPTGITADNNTVTLHSGVTVGFDVCGGTKFGIIPVGTGNKLELIGSGQNVGENLNGFQNLDFSLPSTLTNGGAILTVGGTADITGATVSIDGSGISLSVGDAVVLIDASAGTLIGTPTNSTVSDGTRNWNLSVSGNKLIATLSAVTYDVNIGTFVNGAVTADKTDYAAGETATLTIAPAAGYELNAISACKTGEATTVITLTVVNVTTQTFTMPAYDVTVTATFKKTQATLDAEAVAAAKTAIEGANWTVAQATANSEADVKSWLAAQINLLIASTSITVTASNITITGFNAATAGTNGSFSYTVSLTKGSSNATTASKAGTITAPVNAQTPTINSQPQGTTVDVGSPVSLSVTASVTDGGSLSYQWYSNTTNSNSGGTLIGGATAANYSPSTATAGTMYYYVVVTNTNNSATGTKTATATSNVAAVTVNTLVNAQTPTINSQPQGTTVTVGSAVSLSVTASKTDGGTLSHQWYSNTTNSNSGGTLISGATGANYSPSTATVGTMYYYVVVTNTNSSVNGVQTATVTSNVATVTVTAPVNAQTPTINSQPQGTTVDVGSPVNLSVTASVTDGGSLSYQWYSNTANSNSGGTLISGATNANYSPSTSTVGTMYYYVVVKNTNNSATGTKTATATSNVAAVSFTATVTRYTLTFDTYNGSVSANESSYEKGEEVILTVMPDDGYYLYSIDVYGNSGWAPVSPKRTGANTYTFRMPDFDVTVETVFREIEVKSISLVQTSDPLTVRIVNTGNTHIDRYTLTLTGNDAESFTVAPELRSGSAPFTGKDLYVGDEHLVRFVPGDNLYSGTYSLMLTCSVSGTAPSALSIWYRHIATSGNESITSGKLSAYTVSDRLHVSGLTPGKMWSVYNMSGVLLYRSKAVGDSAEIILQGQGVLVVVCDGERVKVRR